MRLNDTYAIAYPIALCEPLNADFDGDNIAVQLVPPEVADETYKKMSPRYVTTYRKNNQTIFPFNHETLNGLAVASEYIVEDPSELEEPREYYTDYTQLLKDVEVDRKFSIGKPIRFTGEVGKIKYQDKITSYGRLRLSKILEADIDEIGIFKNKTDRINAGAAAKLSTWLANRPKDGIEKRLAVQKFALSVVSKAGVVTFDYKTLYTDTNTETYRKICEVADSKELNDKQKLLLMTEEYGKYEKEIEGKFSDDLKNELGRANRVKLSSITSMSMPQFILSGVDEKPVITRGTLLDGYSEKDFQYHSIENRSLQAIKQSGVLTNYPLN